MAEARSTPVERAFPFWICQVQFSASTSGSSQLPLSPNETSLLSRLSAGTRHACGGHTHTHGQGHIHIPDTPKDIHRDTHTHTTEINLRKWQHIAIKHLWFCFFVCFLSINCVSLHKYRSSPSCSSLPNVEVSPVTNQTALPSSITVSDSHRPRTSSALVSCVCHTWEQFLGCTPAPSSALKQTNSHITHPPAGIVIAIPSCKNITWHPTVHLMKEFAHSLFCHLTHKACD